MSYLFTIDNIVGILLKLLFLYIGFMAGGITVAALVLAIIYCCGY